jgi:hypothetical protein
VGFPSDFVRAIGELALAEILSYAARLDGTHNNLSLSSRTSALSLDARVSWMAWG